MHCKLCTNSVFISPLWQLSSFTNDTSREMEAAGQSPCSASAPQVFLQWVLFISAPPDRISLGKGFPPHSPEFLGSFPHMNLVRNSGNQELFVINGVFNLILRVQEFKTVEEKSKSKHESSYQDSVLISGGSSKDLYRDRRFQGKFPVSMTNKS